MEALTTRSQLFSLANPHFLLKIVSSISLHDIGSAPSWVEQALSRAPYVVVRRKLQSVDGIAIGVRGSSRNERWPDTISADQVQAVIPPYALRASKSGLSERLELIPALRYLLALEQKWNGLSLRWGPGGSVGFELATGYPASSPTSDLDIIVYAPSAFDWQYARTLLNSAREISQSLDVLVETPVSAFSLDEYASSGGAPLLLRYADKLRLGSDPWSLTLQADSGVASKAEPQA